MITSTKKLIELGNSDYKEAHHSVLTHYTSIKNINIIKKDGQMKANCITKYKEMYKEANQYCNEQEKLVFVICFTYKKYSPKEVKRFNKEASFSIDFGDDMDMYKIFNYDKPIIASNGDVLIWCNKPGKHIQSKNQKSHIQVDVKCIDPEYYKEEDLTKYKGERTYVINKTPKLRKKEKYQRETRYEFLIRTTNTEISIDEYEYLLIPVKVDLISEELIYDRKTGKEIINKEEI